MRQSITPSYAITRDFGGKITLDVCLTPHCRAQLRHDRLARLAGTNVFGLRALVRHLRYHWCSMTQISRRQLMELLLVARDELLERRLIGD